MATVRKKLRKKSFFPPIRTFYYWIRVVIPNHLNYIFNKKNDTRKFLFILSPPNCGSTLLNEVISSASAVSANNEIGTTREGQTIPSVRKVMFDHGWEKRWDETIQFDWKYIQKEWLKHWDLTKPVLLEKSPPNIVRAVEIEKTFKPSYFVIFYRNPYAHCESLMRRENLSALDAAKFAIKCLKYQIRNRKTLKNQFVISYENFTDNPQAYIEKFSNFMPELGDIKVDMEFKAHNYKGKNMKITNLNKEKIAKLTAEELKAMNSVFTKNKEILDYFGYDLI